MSGMMRISSVALATLAMACSGGGAGGSGKGKSKKMSMDEGMMQGGSDEVGELGPGKGWESWKKANTEKFLSPTHGKRFVEIHVNDVGYEAYVSGKPMPVGSVVVKPSWEAKDGKPTEVTGPLFVMEKKAKGYDEDNENWYYAIYWPDPSPAWKKRLGGKGIYWQSPSKKIEYCVECHEGYDRYLGLPSKEVRIWKGKKGDDESE